MKRANAMRAKAIKVKLAAMGVGTKDLFEKEELARALSAAGIAASLVRTIRGPAVEVATPADDDTPAVLRAVCEHARDVGVGVRSFEPAQRPLEEVFIASLREAEAAQTPEVLHAPA